LFDSDADCLEFMEDWGIDKPRIKVLVESGRLSEAAGQHFAKGREIEGIDLLLKDKQNTVSMNQAAKYILQKL
jgi:hypothetical protein